MATMALAWVLRQDNLASVIIGATRPEQVHHNAEASGVKLSRTADAIDEALGDVASPAAAWRTSSRKASRTASGASPPSAVREFLRMHRVCPAA